MIWSSHLEVGRLRFSVLVECLDWVMERQKNRDHSAGSWFMVHSAWYYYSTAFCSGDSILFTVNCTSLNQTCHVGLSFQVCVIPSYSDKNLICLFGML